MNKIYLVGLPGAGKSHCGRWLANEMNWEFIDLDGMIEQSMQKRVSEIFDEHGEEVFRQIEAEELRKTENLHNTVVSSGGGTAAWHNNMDWMLRHGLTLYINTPIDRIAVRILKNAQKRPLFLGMDESQIVSKLHEISENRGEFYSQAKIIWNKEMPEAALYRTVKQLLSLYAARF